MLAAARTRSLPVRLLGVQLSNLGAFEQLSLFDQHEKAAAVVDQIREKYGFATVTLATQLGGADAPAKLAIATSSPLPPGRGRGPHARNPGS
jgi:hypothetical protein